MVQRLRELRLEAKMSQQQLADVIGVSQQAINKYENHSVEPDIAMLIKMADVFLVTVDYLIGRTDRNAAPEQSPLSQEERRILHGYHSLTDRERESILLVMRNYEENRREK